MDEVIIYHDTFDVRVIQSCKVLKLYIYKFENGHCRLIGSHFKMRMAQTRLLCRNGLGIIFR